MAEAGDALALVRVQVVDTSPALPIHYIPQKIVKLPDEEETMQVVSTCMHNVKTLPKGGEKIDQLVKDLRWLEKTRRETYNDLEVQSIWAERLRTQLREFPINSQKDIEKAVAAARQLNGDRLDSLREKLSSSQAKMQQMVERQHWLESQIFELTPIRDEIQVEHDKQILALNQQMSNKAEKQIVLNETKDKVRDANERVIDLNEDMQGMREDFIEFKKVAKQKKQELSTAVERESKTLKREANKTSGQKEVLDTTLGKLKKAEVQLHDSTHTLLVKQEKLCDLHQAQANLRRRIEEQDVVNIRLRKEIEGTAVKKEKEEKIYLGKQEDLKTKVLEFEGRIEEEEARRAELAELEQEARKRILALEPIVTGLDNKVIMLQSELGVRRDELKKKMERCSTLKQEIDLLQNQMVQLEEGHKSIQMQLNREIEVTRERLAEERETRRLVKEEADKLAARLAQARSVLAKFLKDSDSHIASAENRYEELRAEGVTLQAGIRSADQKMTNLKADLEQEKKNYAETKTKLEAEVAAAETALAEAQAKLDEANAERDIVLPPYEALKEYAAQKKSEMDLLRKELVGRKNRVLALETQCNDAMKFITGFEMRKKTLEGQLKKTRENQEAILKKLHEEMQDLESRVYSEGARLAGNVAENERLEEANKNMDEDLTKMVGVQKEEAAAAEAAKIRVIETAHRLQFNWLKYMEDEAPNAVIDAKYIAAYESVAAQTTERHEFVSRVLGDMRDTTSNFQEFLDILDGAKIPGKIAGSSSSHDAAKRWLELLSVDLENLPRTPPAERQEEED